MDKLWKDNKNSLTVVLAAGVGLFGSYMIYKKLAENEQVRLLEKEKADKEAEATRKQREEEDRILAAKIRQDRLEKEKADKEAADAKAIRE